MIDQDAITSRVVSNLSDGETLLSLSADDLFARIEAAFAQIVAETPVYPVAETC